MGGQATRGARPDWAATNEWRGRFDVPSRAADIFEMLARRWWVTPGPHEPPLELTGAMRAHWAGHQHERRN